MHVIFNTLLYLCSLHSKYVVDKYRDVLMAILSKHCLIDQLKKNEMNGACGMYVAAERGI
jgi:hypothetical protein